jgi:hypothetical protein
MDLVERYVQDVRTFLPKRQQDDIISELSENIRAELEDREEELGRPLTEAEQEEILRRHGHPMLVASRYQTNQGSLAFGPQLIGSGLFPFYAKALWIIIGVSLAIHVVVLVALAVAGTPPTVGDSLGSIALQVLIQFLVITSIFASVDRALPALRWSPSRSTPKPAQKPKPYQVSRLESVGQIVAVSILLFWLGFVYKQPAVVFGPFADTYRLAPIWSLIAVPTALMFLATIVQSAINLVRPGWVRLRLVVRLCTNTAWLAILVVLLLAAQWVVLVAPGSNADTLHTINEVIFWGLLTTLFGSTIGISIDAWIAIRDDRRHAAQVMAAAS